ncbi:hypothetical protein GCM10027155_16680 [Acinetobacter apis]|uniref:Uncharacterized protein n=2 Tax=Acinetobacter apis TaxID=1229165 RepID=A0A217EGZ2_9GAMM|nr:hypothetical protein SAMN05444584_1551 [Acinetobacter apis]
MQFQSIYANATVGEWNLSDPVVNGATTRWKAIKNTSNTSPLPISTTTTALKVTNHLAKNGLSELALNAVIPAVPEGTDFIVDVPNQYIKYSLKKNNHNTSKYQYTSPFGQYTGYEAYIYTLEQARLEVRKYLNEYPGEGNFFITECINREYQYECYWGSKGEESNPYGYSFFFSQTTNDEYDANAKPELLSLRNLSSKILILAKQKNVQAEKYISSVIQDMLLHDEAYRKSLEAQLNTKLQASQNTGSNNGNNSTPPNNDDEDDANNKIDTLLKKTTLETKKGSKKGAKNSIYDRIGGGGFEQVMTDFNSLALKNIRNIPSKPNETVVIGQLRNNQWVTARSYSTRDGRPTLEITDKSIKIRY